VSGSAEGGAVVYSKHPTRYKVRKGDTVLSVADDFGVAPDRLRRWNRLKGNQLSHARTLVIYKPLAPGEHDTTAVKHRRKKSKATTKTAARHSAPRASGTTIATGNH